MPKTPTKEWMKRCVKSLKKSKRTKTPAKLCGWVWYHEMSKKAKKKAYQEELKRKNRSDMSKRSSSVESKLGLTKRTPKRVSVRVCRKYDLSTPLESLYSAASKYKAEWMGKKPSHCDICKCDIKTCFIDGKTKMGPWAIMCEKCYDKYGTGLGVGRGQKYEIKKDSSKHINKAKNKKLKDNSFVPSYNQCGETFYRSPSSALLEVNPYAEGSLFQCTLKRGHSGRHFDEDKYVHFD